MRTSLLVELLHTLTAGTYAFEATPNVRYYNKTETLRYRINGAALLIYLAHETICRS